MSDYKLIFPQSRSIRSIFRSQISERVEIENNSYSVRDVRNMTERIGAFKMVYENLFLIMSESLKDSLDLEYEELVNDRERYLLVQRALIRHAREELVPFLLRYVSNEQAIETVNNLAATAILDFFDSHLDLLFKKHNLNSILILKGRLICKRDNEEWTERTVDRREIEGFLSKLMRRPVKIGDEKLFSPNDEYRIDMLSEELINISRRKRYSLSDYEDEDSKSTIENLKHKLEAGANIIILGKANSGKSSLAQAIADSNDLLLVEEGRELRHANSVCIHGKELKTAISALASTNPKRVLLHNCPLSTVEAFLKFFPYPILAVVDGCNPRDNPSLPQNFAIWVERDSNGIRLKELG